MVLSSSTETRHNVVAYGIHADFSLGPKVFQEIHDVLHEFEVGILGKSNSISVILLVRVITSCGFLSLSHTHTHTHMHSLSVMQ